MRNQLRFLTEPLPVLIDPVFRPSPVLAGEEPSWRLPQSANSRSLLTFSGTAAVYQAIRALDLGGRKVLLPAYNCGHELEAVLRAGAPVDFFRIDARLQIDLEHLASRIDANTGAVLVTHYFGFPQPLAAIRALCAARGLTLIEDCAHALFSCDGQQPLGLAGGLAVYSLRKTLPLPHGGALVCHESSVPIPEKLGRPPYLSTLPKSLERRQKAWLMPEGRAPGAIDRAGFFAGRLLVELARAARNGARAAGRAQLDPDDESLAFPAEALEWGMDEAVERNLFRHDAAHIVAARRRNYGQLLAAADRFQGCRPLLPELPEGVCPLYFPLIADDIGSLQRRFARAAITAIEWWTTFHSAVPWQDFPVETSLKQQLIAVPVHHDLAAAHMDRIIDVLSVVRGAR